MVAKYDARLEGRKFLLVPYHMVGAESMEAGVLGGYVEHVRKLHPEAPLPGVYLDESLLADAESLRDTMGDDAFFANLGGGDDEGFGDLAGGWDAARFDAALKEKPGSPERNALVSDYIDAYAPSTKTIAGASGGGFVPFAHGLDAISRHAKKLGYDGVVLFLDELILWFASRMADPAFVEKEGQKVAKLVEASSVESTRPDCQLHRPAARPAGLRRAGGSRCREAQVQRDPRVLGEPVRRHRAVRRAISGPSSRSGC